MEVVWAITGWSFSFTFFGLYNYRLTILLVLLVIVIYSFPRKVLSVYVWVTPRGLWVKEQATVVFVILRVSFYPITKACMCFFLLPHSSWPPAFTVPDTQSSTALQEACVPDRSSSAAFLPSLLDFLALHLCTCACKSQTKNVKSIVHI